MTESKRGGRCRFSEALASAILEMARAGKTNDQMAEDLGISPATINNWCHRFPEFSEALKDAKAAADDQVVMALFQKAVGYRTKAVKFFYNQKTGEVVREEYMEQYPPDTTAAIFWLKNRRREEWRDVHKIEMDKKVTIELPSPKDAVRILQEDYATLPAVDVKVEDL